ncbi:hypothetical protein NE237_029063 [Protea cynaroides]|uniref:Uncharacterized protein n=1 Tax=Protea cynaroides TaxID=273540 RepID=A0A9Q0JUE9_9MAGN|nr:hypothetical protein NE237_029063 [Protea cynaroides]
MAFCCLLHTLFYYECKKSHREEVQIELQTCQGLQEKGEVKLLARRSRGHALRVLANPNVSPRKGSFTNEVVMVDPLEAKRLADKQMQEIQAKERLIKRRQIEAINGAWAMIGLTAGLVVEGQTGNGILAQLAGYLATFIGFFIR